MALRLPASSKNTLGLKRDSNAKPAGTPHWRSMIMVRQARQEDNWKLGQSCKAVCEQLHFDLQTANINRRSQSLHT
jgi:hypothetical protein